MDWKREAVDKLKNYEAKKSSLVRSTEEIKRLEDLLTNIRSATTDGTPVSGGGGSGRENALVNNIALRQELTRARKDAARWVRLVDSAMDMLDDQERLILDRFYIHPAKGNVDRLCDELGVERTRVYERKDNALRHFTLSLYGMTET